MPYLQYIKGIWVKYQALKSALFCRHISMPETCLESSQTSMMSFFFAKVANG